ncbi:MAG: DUF4231 domain-containing protein [Elainella sp. Prado103]|nr:DUF4231 domain-containing protein [Elainella sp. Prado103]
MTGRDMAGNDTSEVFEAPTGSPLAPASTRAKSSHTYNDQLKQDFKRIFDLLPLTPLQKEFLQSRWLDQVLWMEKKAARCRNRYTWLRMTTIIGGVLVPILVTLTVNDEDSDQWLNDLVILGSGVVAVSSAVEGFFSYGKQWYSYRQSVESLKSHGWQFFQLTGAYTGQTHASAFALFATQVEELIQRDVELYVTQLNQQKQLQETDQELLQKLRDLDIPVPPAPKLPESDA